MTLEVAMLVMAMIPQVMLIEEYMGVDKGIEGR